MNLPQFGMLECGWICLIHVMIWHFNSGDIAEVDDILDLPPVSLEDMLSPLAGASPRRRSPRRDMSPTATICKFGLI